MSTRILLRVYLQTAFLFCITVTLTTIATSSNFITRDLAEKETDGIALQAFKSKIIHDPQRVLNSWNDSRNFCKWVGVTCSRRHQRVTILDLHSRGLIGSLSPYIGNLSFLREITLSNNSIQGEIPHQVGRLFRLKVLNLGNNSLVGEIPANLSRCFRLTKLHLGGNKLVGKIPLDFIALYNLETLAIHWNNLTGSIPTFIGNLTSLVAISASYNPFGGNIPYSLGRLRELRYLGLGGNDLSGIVPPSIYNLSLLVICSLSENQLHGNLPPSLGLNLPNLQRFQISMNFFDGFLPMSLSNASELEFFEIVGNNFSGKLSVNFGGMQQLSYLNLASNSLGSGEADEMKFISSLTNCSNLQYLSLDQNQFRGELPHSIANLSTQFQSLIISKNKLHGSIPSGIGSLVNLNYLGMEYNKFTGSIPKEMGRLRNLKWLALHDNQLSGQIPSFLGNLSSLDELHLDNNKLSGFIPSSLGNLKQLTILHLFQNELSGTIPEEIFDITHLSVSLNLAQNHFVGTIPPTIGSLKNLARFSVSDNDLSGEIPSEIGLCSSLEKLYMRGNFFHGSIPSSLSSLRGIRDIDLSHNNLSGQIPKFLETLPLENLDLSFNNLEGEVPTKGIFTNASAMSVAGNNDRLCGGIPELQLAKCTKKELKKGKISQAIKILVSATSAFSGLAMVTFLTLCWLKKRRKQPSGTLLRKSLLKVSYQTLLKATDGFSSEHLIGLGSFGSVYKGILDGDGTVVAIKILNLQRQRASKSFMAECKALRNIRHRNLVKVITSCSSIDFQSNDFKAIVYEYMPNGSLERWLHQAPETEEEQSQIHNLTLVQRTSIAIDVASAINYLHHHCQEAIIHCDLKPNNVLLDGDMIAHVGDFGLAKFLPEVSNPNQSSSVGVRGTIGYTAPEYGLGSNVSTKGDVYSFGILLLEIVTRKRPTDLMFEGGLNLHNFARIALPDRVMDIVDPMLINVDEDFAATNHRLIQERSDTVKECLISMIKIGVACSMESPQDRMNITDVVHELQLVKNILLEPRARQGRQRSMTAHVH